MLNVLWLCSHLCVTVLAEVPVECGRVGRAYKVQLCYLESVNMSEWKMIPPRTFTRNHQLLTKHSHVSLSISLNHAKTNNPLKFTLQYQPAYHNPSQTHHTSYLESFMVHHICISSIQGDATLEDI